MNQPEPSLFTSRWTPMKEHGVPGLTGVRMEYWKCEKRFIAVAAGGRSLKTEIAKRKFIKRVIYDPLRAEVDQEGWYWYFFAGPTEKQTKAIAWDDLRAMVPKEMIVSVDYSNLVVKLVNKAAFQIVGLDKPQRIEGHPWNGGVITEFADIKDGSWEANIRPILADYKGWIIIEGRPDFEKPNNDKFKELCERGRKGSPKYSEEWAFFQWHSEEVLDPLELEDAQETMSPEMYAQEFGGSFITAPGRAYHRFVETTHVNDAKAFFRPELPLGVSCDFNAEHHNWGLYQMTKEGDVIAFDKIYILNGQVEDMLLDLDDKLKEYNPKEIVFYGDYSGNNRSAVATFSAWQQIRNHFDGLQGRRSAEFHYHKQPPISERMEKVNGKLTNAKGQHHLWVHSRCTELIEDFGKVTRKMLYSQQKGDKLTHASDNLGYFVVQYRD